MELHTYKLKPFITQDEPYIHPEDNMVFNIIYHTSELYKLSEQAQKFIKTNRYLFGNIRIIIETMSVDIYQNQYWDLSIDGTYPDGRVKKRVYYSPIAKEHKDYEFGQYGDDN
jgi:hypothetical protein